MYINLQFVCINIYLPNKKSDTFLTPMSRQLQSQSLYLQFLRMFAKKQQTQEANGQSSNNLIIGNTSPKVYPESQYVNRDFPKQPRVGIRSLYGRQVKFEWKSLGQTIKGIRLFKNIQPGDIYQRNLNDCYFLASISAIADTKKQIIKNLFKKVNDYKRNYTIQLIIGGQKQQITIDDQVPFEINEKGELIQPLFASIHKNGNDVQSWVMLLQKAWAKVNGGYEKIWNGDLVEAFFALTGCYSEIHPVVGSWEKIKKAAHANLPMVVGSRDNISIDKQLVNMHVYTILNAELILGRRMIMIRNPFGHTEPNVKIAYRGSNQHDGIFWMLYEQFEKHFGIFSIAKVIDDAKFSSLPIKNKNCGIVQINVKTKGMYSISISTQLYRSFTAKERPKMILGPLKEQQILLKLNQLKVFDIQKNPRIKPSERVSYQWILDMGDNYFFFQKSDIWPSQQKILNFSVYGPYEAEIKLLIAE